jgi:DNA-directed RNA polymerase subunit RPC12/RpoP
MTSSSTNTAVATCPQCGADVSLPDWADLTACPYCGSDLRREPAFRPAGVAAPAGTSPPPPGDPRPVAQEQVLRSLSCPQCAGPLSVHAGRRILLCGHCGVRVLVRSTGGFSRWLFLQTVDHLQALGVAGRWLNDYPGISRQARDVPLTRARLVHVPVWEHTALIAGWEFGTKLRTRYHLVEGEEGTERLDLTVAEERFEEPHLQERRFFQTACDLESLGATRPRFSGRELLLPLVAGEVDPSSMVIEPQGAAADIAERGRRLALQPASGAADPLARLLILKEALALLYYPLWLVDYQVAGRDYRVVVDAHDPGVNSATAPGRRGRITPSLGVRVVVLIAVAVVLLWLGSLWDGARVPTILIAVIVFVAAILLVLRSPGGGKVEYHEPFSS